MNAASEKPHLSPDTPTFASPDALIDHLLSRYHEVHRQQLPELIRLARKVESVHQDDPAVPVGLADFLEIQQQELLSHMQKEEQILFPMLRAGGNPFISQPIAMMRHEHVDHGLQLEKLVSLTNEMQAPAGACNSWRTLYAGVAQFHDDLIQHIHLENNCLFPMFEGKSLMEGGA